MNILNLSLCCVLPFHPSLFHCLKAMLLVGIFASQGLPTVNSFFTPCPERLGGVLQMSSDTDDRMGAKIKTLKKFPQTPNPPKKSHGGFVSLKNFQKALNLITRKIPKTYSPNFLIRKNPGIKTFELKKILRSSLHMKFGVPPRGPTGPTSIIILFLTIPISIRRKCSGSRKTALIFHQILSTNSLRKCREINVENLCVNIRANVFSVCLFFLGGGAKLIK